MADCRAPGGATPETTLHFLFPVNRPTLVPLNHGSASESTAALRLCELDLGLFITKPRSSQKREARVPPPSEWAEDCDEEAGGKC
ncbi:Hypothetical protein SMAX5B_009242 [Scophthalmus maximus]|uniref:Uncharacterized protein n=1 Tax=Scophthalmus maximus TaxID=52904 RepID=A0A2U9C465_SCOMX|nr:Hypothetical protein SMAX5B_009242 [Scophthalmus maximus]